MSRAAEAGLLWPTPPLLSPDRRIPRAALLPAATREPGGWHRHLHATHPESLPEMNRQRTNVLPDIRGKSCMAILRAIVAGERDPYPRAELCAHRVRRL